VSTYRTVGRPYLIPPTSIANDAHFRYDNPTQSTITRGAHARSENLHLNVRESARARLAMI
jgi:hypothetical protein